MQIQRGECRVCISRWRRASACHSRTYVNARDTHHPMRHVDQRGGLGDAEELGHLHHAPQGRDEQDIEQLPRNRAKVSRKGLRDRGRSVPKRCSKHSYTHKIETSSLSPRAWLPVSFLPALASRDKRHTAAPPRGHQIFKQGHRSAKSRVIRDALRTPVRGDV